MVTLILQAVISAQALLFGVLAILVSRWAAGIPEVQRVSWGVVGLAFTIGGVSSVVQDVGAVWAFRSGPGSAVWNEYLTWMPVANHGRAFLKVALALALVGAVVARRHLNRGYLRLTVVVLLVALGIGGVVGRMEGPFQGSVHYANAAIFDTVEMIALLMVLFVGLLFSSLDRLLWVALAVYTVRQALNAIIWTALAWIGVSGAWAPSPIQAHLLGVVSYAIIIGIAVRRLQLSRRGVQVPGLFDLPTERRPSLLI